MRHVILIAKSDEYDCEPGLALAGMPNFEGFMADRSGLSIAHDILEHQNGTKEMGPVWDELEALGGIWQVRGRHGDLMTGRPNYHSVAANIASDISRMFSQWDCEDMGYCGPGGLKVGSRPHDYDEDFAECIELARKSIKAEYRDMGNGSPDEDENGWAPHLHDALEVYLTLALHRMRAGFRKAQKRFGSDYKGADLFVAIRDAVGRVAKHVEYEGQRFRLSYGNREARCVELWDDGE